MKDIESTLLYAFHQYQDNYMESVRMHIKTQLFSGARAITCSTAKVQLAGRGTGRHAQGGNCGTSS